MGGQCYNGNSHNYGRGSYETAIRSNLNVMKDQKFKITLKESNMKDYNKKVILKIKITIFLNKLTNEINLGPTSSQIFVE